MAEAPTRLEDDQGRGRLVRRNPAVLWRRSVNCVLAGHPDQDEITVLESPAHIIWQLLDCPRSVDEIANQMVASFEAEEAEIRRDVDAFVSSLVEKDLAMWHERTRA